MACTPASRLGYTRRLAGPSLPVGRIEQPDSHSESGLLDHLPAQTYSELIPYSPGPVSGRRAHGFLLAGQPAVERAGLVDEPASVAGATEPSIACTGAWEE